MSFRRSIPKATSGSAVASSASQLPLGTRRGASGQVLVSTGIDSLDGVLGGGVPLGTILLLKEDRFSAYALRIVSSFVAQGLCLGHAALVVGPEPERFLRDLPPKSNRPDRSKSSRVAHSDEGGSMRIAWRYAEMGSFDATPGSSTGPARQPGSTSKKVSFDPMGLAAKAGADDGDSAYRSTFDFSRRINEAELAGFRAQTTAIDVSRDFSTLDDGPGVRLDQLMERIRAVTHDNPSSPLRIAISSLGDHRWSTASREMEPRVYAAALFRFIHQLRATLRGTLASAVITVPAFLFGDEQGGNSSSWMIHRLKHAADAVLEIESFAGTSRSVHPAYVQEYHGLVHPLKLFRVGTLSHSSRLTDLDLQSLAFRVRRKTFSIETFHLPPELGEQTGDAVQEETGKTRPDRAGASPEAGIAIGRTIDF